MTAAPGSAEYPRTFIGLDLETTGVDSSIDRIIEIGATRITDGEVVDTFEAFVDPGISIPPDVVYLTGITDRDVSGAPRVEDVLPDLIRYLGDDPLVAHSAGFDLAFLAAAAKGDPDLLAGRGGVFDTLGISRALLPRLPSHRLAKLVEFFGITHEHAHRAGDDARAVAFLFIELLGVLDQIGSAIVGRMLRLASPEIAKLLEVAKERSEGRLDPFALPDHGERAGELLRYDNARRVETPRFPTEEKMDIDLDALEGLFEEGGAISQRLSDYEVRREQLQMMRAVGDALVAGVHLVIEAGTGVGKSLAYLVPSIAFAVANGERVIVSTNTKNLQEQLFMKDMPFLEETMADEFSAALLKGRGNYICVERWRGIAQRGLSPSERAELLPLALWEEETTSGDISENAAFRRRGYLWSRVSSDGGPCLGQRCPSSDRCYLLNARRAAQSAHVVIVNHSLLFSDTEAGNRILGEYSYLVCDEAHNIEQIATEHLGRRASIWRARAVLDSLYRKDGVESGDLAELLEEAQAGDDAGILSTVAVAARRLVDDVSQAQAASEAFFAALSERHEELNDGRRVEFGKLRYGQRKDDETAGTLLAGELEEAVRMFKVVAGGSEALSNLVADTDLARVDSIVQGLTFHTERARTFARDLDYVASAADPESVFWLEVRTYREGRECEMRSAPVSVSELMGDFLYSRLDSIVMTSATLTVDESFGFFMERVGLDRLPDWKVIELDVGSPYDHDRQSIAAVAAWLPAPSSSGFNQVVADLVVKLAAPAEGGTLVLFTARSSLDAVFKAVRDPLTARGKLVLGQGHGGGASALLDQFAKEIDSVLLATSSFWEGVDVPGRSLEQLIIVKLPFPVPRDPVVEAHCERYEMEGERSFDRYMVPRTAIRLRQGFGRLIRSTTDTGVVVFLDSRLETKRYGARLLEQLPTPAFIAHSEEELLRAIGAVPVEQADS